MLRQAAQRRPNLHLLQDQRPFVSGHGPWELESVSFCPVCARVLHDQLLGFHSRAEALRLVHPFWMDRAAVVLQVV